MAEPSGEKDKDKGGKWLIEHHGDSILRFGGVTDLVRWHAGPAEVVLPSRLPDGLLYAWRAGRDRPEPYIIEIATYPETRAAEQALRDLMLVYLSRNEVPNVIVVVLRPKGQLRVPDHARRAGPDGVTEFNGRWRVIELWNVPAEPVLATADPGIMPWVPLMHSTEPPEVVLRRCIDVIDRNSQADDHDRLMAVTEVFTRLRYNDSGLVSILKRGSKMIEEAYELGKALLIRDAIARKGQKDVFRVLRARFGSVTPEIEAEVKTIRDESVLDTAIDLAASSPDIGTFAAELRAVPRPPEPWDPADEPEPNR